jgi:polar amino acid transport system substrate-binding protein
MQSYRCAANVNWVCCGALIAMACAALASAETLPMAGYFKPPFMMEAGDKPGICVEMVQEAGKRLGHDVSYKLLPIKRLKIEFKAEKILMEPAVTPAWRLKDKAFSVYSKPHFNSIDVVLTREEDAVEADGPVGFHGKILGCVLGYSYTDGFQEAFEDGTVQREDAPSHRLNLQKLIAGRVDAIIIHQFTAKYLMQELAIDPAGFKSSYTLKTTQLSIRFHKSKGHLVPEFDAVLKKMKEDGTIKKITQKYLK